MRLTGRGKNPYSYVGGVDSPRAEVSNRSKPLCEAECWGNAHFLVFLLCCSKVGKLEPCLVSNRFDWFYCGFTCLQLLNV